MRSIKTMMAAGVLALGLSTGAAHAVTAPGSVSFPAEVSGVSSVLQFNWSNTAVSIETTQSYGYNFNFSLDSYSGTGIEQTGFYLDRIVSGTRTRLTNVTTACSSAMWASRGLCNLITASTPDGTELFSNLAAGDYGIGIFDSATPESGSLAFKVSKVAPIPLPAAGFLLLGALGGIAALRRRKNAA
jgi:hypothetical protein